MQGSAGHTTVVERAIESLEYVLNKMSDFSVLHRNMHLYIKNGIQETLPTMEHFKMCKLKDDQNPDYPGLISQYGEYRDEN